MQGAFQHIKIYPEGFTLEDKEEFKHKVREKLYKIGKDYTNSEVPSATHLSTIDVLSKKFGFSFGVAQKLLNLYLKYLWCMGEIKIPPHCPVDSQILKQVKINNPPWSKMSERDYKNAIDKIEKESKNKGFENMAEWELNIWKSPIASVYKSG